MVKKIALALVVILVALAGFIATRPAGFSISRSRTISAPPQAVYALVNDFHKWPQWSPWEKIDPDMKREHDGPPAGPGATYAWAGNSDVGEGRMTITDSSSGRNVRIRLEFLKPFAATNTTTFDLAPEGPGTRVTWTMTGENNFMAKAFSLVMDMDEMIGADFERGLVNLEQAAAAVAKAMPPMM